MPIANLRKILDPVKFWSETMRQGLRIKLRGIGYLQPVQTIQDGLNQACEKVPDPNNPPQLYADFAADGKLYRIQAFPANLTLTEKLPDGEE